MLSYEVVALIALTVSQGGLIVWVKGLQEKCAELQRGADWHSEELAESQRDLKQLKATQRDKLGV